MKALFRIKNTIEKEKLNKQLAFTIQKLDKNKRKSKKELANEQIRMMEQKVEKLIDDNEQLGNTFQKVQDNYLERSLNAGQLQTLLYENVVKYKRLDYDDKENDDLSSQLKESKNYFRA